MSLIEKKRLSFAKAHDAFGSRGVQQKVHKRKNSDSVRKYEGVFRRRVHKWYTRRKTPSSYQPDEFLILDEVNLYAPVLCPTCFRIIAGNRLFGAGTGRI